jgi:hypothetical protein
MSTLPVQNRDYVGFVQQIFPTIYHVGSRPVSNNSAQVEVIMSYEADGPPREGISVALSECGTGVSQILALLYVVVTAQSRRIIVIDEPNSFLHPGAAKKLISILKQFDHQYIISTHSADLIRVIDPDVLHQIGWKETASTFETVDRTSIQHQRKILADLGVSLSDVFGADQPIHELERYMRCKDCSHVRGYPYKRSHLVALRTTKISASDPPSTWWPGER